jgi:hypothetical protein
MMLMSTNVLLVGRGDSRALGDDVSAYDAELNLTSGLAVISDAYHYLQWHAHEFMGKHYRFFASETAHAHRASVADGVFAREAERMRRSPREGS